jgi:hypothetical protein
MNQKERDRLALFSRVRDKQMLLIETCEPLGLSYRQIKRLYKCYLGEGDAGLVHGLRGKPSNSRRRANADRDRAIALYREHYLALGFGPTLASQQMAARQGLTVDHETLRRWLIGAGLWQPRGDKSRHHRRWRPRKACFGELVQFDGSDHAWFGEPSPRCCLMVMIDDATGMTLARFFEAETTLAAMTVLRCWIERFGLPGELYPDRHSIHRRNDKQADEIEHRTGKRPRTRFGQALADLGVKLTCAHSPQAKGRVERMNGTLQDRLVKLLALEKITTIQAANEYLEHTFLPDHNARFKVEPAGEADAHRPAPPCEELEATLCLKEHRVIGNDGCVSLRGRWFQLLGTDNAPRRLKRVEVREHLDGRIELWARGRLLRHEELRDRPAPVKHDQPTLGGQVALPAESGVPTAGDGWRRAAIAG